MVDCIYQSTWSSLNELIKLNQHIDSFQRIGSRLKSWRAQETTQNILTIKPAKQFRKSGKYIP